MAAREGRTLVIWLAAALLLAIFSALLVRVAFVQLRDANSLGNNIWSTRRAAEMVQTLERLDSALNNKRILFSGSSETVVSVRARDIEDKLNASSPGFELLNLGFLSLDPDGLGLLIDRLEETKIGQCCFHSIYIGFQPSRFTERFRLQRNRSAGAFAFEMQLYSPAMIKREFMRDPGEALKTASTLHLFDGVSASEARRYLGRVIFERRQSKGERSLEKVWDFDGPALKGFDFEKRGHFYFDDPGVDPESRELSERFNARRIREAWSEQMNRAYDGLDLHFDPGMLDSLRQQLVRLRRLTKNVVLYYVPPCEQLGVTEDGLKRTAKALQDTAAAGGARLLDLTGAGFVCDDYFDMLHLNRQGQDKMTSLLVEDIRKTP